MTYQTEHEPDDVPAAACAHVLIRDGDRIEPHTLLAEPFSDTTGHWIRLAPEEAGGPVLTVDLEGMRRLIAACALQPWAR